VRDRSADPEERVRFSSSILPPYLRKSKSVEELIPWLYLKSISTGDFSEALQALIGPDATGFSPNVVVRLKEQWSQEYDTWCQRDLSGKQYVYVWADGIYANIRLEDEANSRQCLLVLMGATADGEKELIAVIDDGFRESKQSWLELLLSLKQRGLAIQPKLAKHWCCQYIEIDRKQCNNRSVETLSEAQIPLKHFFMEYCKWHRNTLRNSQLELE